MKINFNYSLLGSIDLRITVEFELKEAIASPRISSEEQYVDAVILEVKDQRGYEFEIERVTVDGSSLESAIEFEAFKILRSMMPQGD